MSPDNRMVTISRFFSSTEEQKQVLQETVILFVLQIKWLVANDIPFSSSTLREEKIAKEKNVEEEKAKLKNVNIGQIRIL